MQKKRHNRKWTACRLCHQMFQFGDEHACPSEAIAKKEAELDMIIDEELSTWDYDLKVFWKSRDVKFTQHLLDTGQYD